MLGSNDRNGARRRYCHRTESETVGFVTASSFAQLLSAIAERDKVMARIVIANQ
jgi:hypothetical protein